MKAELPFEVTPIIKRYLEELVYYIQEYFAGENDDPQFITKYDLFEDKTPRAEKNRKVFWDYLVEIGAVWVGSDSIRLDDSETESIEVRILKAEPIRALFKLSEKTESTKKVGGKIEWNALTFTLTNKTTGAIYTPRKGPKREVFTALWNERISKKESKKGIPLGIDVLARRAEVVEEIGVVKSVNARVVQLVKDVGTSLKDNGFSIVIKRLENKFQMEVRG
jgi:hypothetical protein